MRLLSIDLCRGCGIFSFIIWHCYAYYYKYSQASSVISRGVLFATGLFIALSGFVFGFHYYEQFARKVYCKRDLVFKITGRCLKLLGYVIAANIGISLIHTRDTYYPDVLLKILSLFYIDRWDITFQVLFVIGIGLFIDLLFLFSFMKYEKGSCYFLITCLIVLFLIDLINQGGFPYLWRYIPLSVAGTMLGILITKRTNQKMPLSATAASTIIFLVLYIVCILDRKWYYYLLSETGPYHLLIISLLVGFVSMEQYLHNVKNKLLSILSGIVVTLGRYSLFVYFLHIIVIYFSLRFIKEKTLVKDNQIFCIAMVIVIFCILSAKIVEYLRRYRAINYLYHIFFE